MTVDVVVVTYQSSSQLAWCLEALPADVAVVVVDNASTDGSADAAASLGAKVIRNDSNAGFAQAANQGAADGTADFILFLNPDARIASADLETLVKQLDAAPGTAIVGPRLVGSDGTEQRAWWPFPTASRAWAEALGLLRVGGGRLDRHGDGFVVGACLLVRRTVFEALDGFDERFWLYGEEADLCRRATDAGWAVAPAANAVAQHVGGASGIETPELVFEHFWRGSEHFVAKHSGAAALVSYRLALLAGSVLRSAALPGRGRHSSTATERRRIVARLAKVLLRHPTQVHTGNRSATTPRPHSSELVVCSLEAWDEVWRRNQFLVRELLVRDPKLRVLFVQPPVDPVHRLRFGKWPLRDGGRIRMVEGTHRVSALLPLKLLPRALGPFADRSLRRQVVRAATRMGFTDPTLWVNDTTYAGLGQETGWPMLYDITDDWLLEGVNAREVSRRKENECRALADAGVVVVCSSALRESRGAIRDVLLIPNAVDSERFQSRQPRPADLPAGPTAVYVGTLHEQRLDLDLVERLAIELPDVQVVLVGPNAMAANATARLVRHPNIRVLGSRPYEAVPAYLQHADAVIVPHLVTPFTESLDPIKAYECLACGRPTVATPLAAFRELGEPVRTADAEAFVDEVRRALSPNGGDVPDRQIPGWDDRAAEFAAGLDQARTASRRAIHGRGIRRRRVVYLDHCALLSGGELALLRVLPALHDVDAHVILAQDGPLVGRLRAIDISVEVLPMAEDSRSLSRDRVRPGAVPLRSLWHTARYVMATRARLRELMPDLVHTNSLKSALYGGVAARLSGIPVVCHLRDRIADDYLPLSAARLVRTVLRIVPDVVIANSGATLATLGSRTRKGVVIGSPVIYDAVALTGPPRRREPGGPLRVGMVGRFAPWKGQHIFIEAFSRAFPDGDEQAVFVGAPLFGETGYESEIRQLVERLGLGDRVEFRGFVDDVAAELANLDMLVHASVVPEPFGQVVVEGMASGLPVIAAGAGGPLEVLTPGVDGMLFPPGDVAALAVALGRLAADPAARARLGAQAQARAAAFRPDRIAAEISAVYDGLLESPEDYSGRVHDSLRAQSPLQQTPVDPPSSSHDVS